MTAPDALGRQYLATVREEFRNTKAIADRAVAQLDDERLFMRPRPDLNSVAIVMAHIAGNLRSRWTDFLTTDGEKPWRERDREFEDPPRDRAALLARWDAAWETLFATLGELRSDDLGREVQIRREPHTVVRAIERQMSHYGYHVGQIVLLARIAAAAEWRWLSVAPGASDAFNRSKGM